MPPRCDTWAVCVLIMEVRFGLLPVLLWMYRLEGVKIDVRTAGDLSILVVTRRLYPIKVVQTVKGASAQLK